MSWVMSWDVRKYHNGPNCMAWPQDQSIFFKIQAKTIHFIKKSTHRTSQNYLFGLIYSLSVVKPSVFGLVINWYFFCIQFQAPCSNLQNMLQSFTMTAMTWIGFRRWSCLFPASNVESSSCRLWRRSNSGKILGTCGGRWKKSRLILVGGYPHYL